MVFLLFLLITLSQQLTDNELLNIIDMYKQDKNQALHLLDEMDQYKFEFNVDEIPDQVINLNLLLHA